MVFDLRHAWNGCFHVETMNNSPRISWVRRTLGTSWHWWRTLLVASNIHVTVRKISMLLIVLTIILGGVGWSWEQLAIVGVHYCNTWKNLTMHLHAPTNRLLPSCNEHKNLLLKTRDTRNSSQLDYKWNKLLILTKRESWWAHITVIRKDKHKWICSCI